MIVPRAPRDGDRSRTAQLPDSCRTIGAHLTAARETGQLSVEALASKLLLSKGQILGLEQADPSAFYNVDYYLRALRKYMAFMGVPSYLLVEDEDAEHEGGLRLLFADGVPGRSAPVARNSRPWLVAGAVAALVVVAGAGLYLGRTASIAPATGSNGDTVSLVTASPLPAQPQIPTEAPMGVRAEPAAAVVTDGSDSAVRVSVGKPTWIFIRYPDNRVVERRLAAGEALEVGPLPVYLAVGTADSVEVSVENRPVALGPYIRDGQVRLTTSDLARLVP
jgi:Domain of unknown function (DUF4115)